MTRLAKSLNGNATDVIRPDGEPGSSRAIADDMAPVGSGWTCVSGVDSRHIRAGAGAVSPCETRERLTVRDAQAASPFCQPAVGQSCYGRPLPVRPRR